MAKGRKTGDITDIIADVLFYIIGLCALIGGGLILWWGEDQTARYTALSDFAETSLVELDASRVDPALEGRLGHVTGMAESASTLSDQRLGIKEKGFQLRRKVEYYQLVEHKKKVEDKDKAKKYPPEYTYRYQKKWVEKAVPFKAFHDPYFRNKGRAPLANIKGGKVISNRITLGAYRLPRFLAKAVQGEVPVKIALSEEQRSALIESMGLSDPSLLKEWGDGLYIGESPDRPELGDVRIREYVVPLTTVSVLAKIKGDSFEPFRQDESKLNVNIGKIVSGSASAAEMMEDLKSDVGWGAWLVRAVGLPIMLFGLLFLVHGAVNFALGRLIVNGSSKKQDWSLWAVLRLGLILALIVAAAAWMRVNPKAGGILLACAAVLFILPFFRRGNDEPERLGGGGHAGSQDAQEALLQDQPGQSSPEQAMSDKASSGQPQGGAAAAAAAGTAAAIAAAYAAGTADSTADGPAAGVPAEQSDLGQAEAEKPRISLEKAAPAGQPQAEPAGEPEAGQPADASAPDAALPDAEAEDGQPQPEQPQPEQAQPEAEKPAAASGGQAEEKTD